MISFRGLLPADLRAFRLDCIGFAEREGERARPTASGGIALALHPAALPLTLAFTDGALSGEAEVGLAGPGYHAMVCQFLDRLKGRFSPDLLVDDASGYFEDREWPRLEAWYQEFRADLGARVLQALDQSGGPVLVGLPAAARIEKGKGKIVTPLRVYDRDAWRAESRACEDGGVWRTGDAQASAGPASTGLASAFAWWSRERDGLHWLHRGLAYLNVRTQAGRADDRRMRRAIDACGRAAVLDPSLPLPHVQLAAACERYERFDDAIEHLEHAWSADQEARPSLDLLAWRARLLHRVGRLSDAATASATLAERCPQFAEPAYEAALLLNAVGRFEEAIPLLERAEARSARRGKYPGELAVSLAALGRVEAALQALDRALAIEPGNLDGWANRATLCEGLGRLEEAAHARATVDRLRSDGGWIVTDAGADAEVGAADAGASEIALLGGGAEESLQAGP